MSKSGRIYEREVSGWGLVVGRSCRYSPSKFGHEAGCPGWRGRTVAAVAAFQGDHFPLDYQLCHGTERAQWGVLERSITVTIIKVASFGLLGGGANAVGLGIGPGGNGLGFRPHLGITSSSRSSNPLVMLSSGRTATETWRCLDRTSSWFWASSSASRGGMMEQRLGGSSGIVQVGWWARDLHPLRFLPR